MSIRRLSAALTCVAAFATIAEEGDTTFIAEVVVTALGASADRRDGALIDQPGELASSLDERLASIVVTHAQGNRLQPDLSLRGFVGSHLLGLPQGLAVYQDGVRLNEPFGDVINWALVPPGAIETALVEASNPLLGLNALGGAVAIETMSGLTEQARTVEASTGSFGRRGIAATVGAAIGENGAIFGAFDVESEDGWRDHSDSSLSRAFLRADWLGDWGAIDASLTWADTDLKGNGAVPVQLQSRRREAVYTHPDLTQHQLFAATTRWRFERESTSGVFKTYVRSSDVSTLNGDDSDFEPCEDDWEGFLCAEDDDDIGDDVDADDDDLDADDDDDGALIDLEGRAIRADDRLVGATVNRTETRQLGWGVGFELRHPFARHELVVGGSFDSADVEFDSSTELGQLDATRGAIGGGVFLANAETSLETSTRTSALYLANTWSAAERVSITLGGRFDAVDLELVDQIGTALNGNHRFSRFNAMLRVGYRGEGWRGYAKFAETNRAPSPVELTCADPDDPCRLPNGFLADPPLDDVVARTIEAGLRGGEAVGWELTLFRTTNRDDIHFVSAGSFTNEGYFANVGETRRDGFEGRLFGGEKVRWEMAYAYLDATFLDALRLPSPNHPEIDTGEVSVLPGDRLPLLPRHQLKGFVEWRVSDRWAFGLNARMRSEIVYRGDEGNDIEAIDGFVVADAYLDVSISDEWRLRATVENLFDEDYATFGVFGEADEVLGDEFDNPRFITPSMKRGVTLSLRGTW